jgi:3-phenylpropionate/cinnamic acid dioxygenase small subunit
MPAIEDQADPLNHISLMYDDRVMMEIRRRNFVHPRAASKDYTVRASHLISNIRITAFNADTGDCAVTSNFHCVLYYWDKQTLFAGTYRHELVNTDDGFRIKHKRVDLINCDGVLGTIIVYLWEPRRCPLQSIVATHLSSMAIGVGKATTWTVVRAGGSTAKYSAQTRL